MAVVNNILQAVQTYQRAHLAYLVNQSPFIATANTKFKDFEKIQANLGSSVSFDLPPRYTTVQGLVATFQPSVQRVQVLTASQSANTSFAFTSQDRMFNVEKDIEPYMLEFGKSAVIQLANSVEIDVAKNATSAVVNQVTGLSDPNSGPYRFFGDGLTPINSFGQLAQMIANFKNYGAVRDGIKVYLPDINVPSIVNTGLNQFSPRRNDEIALSWEVGQFGTPPVDYYQSNLLPTHFAGQLGINQTTLTVVSTNDPTGANITQVTFSGAGAFGNAVLSGDLGQFLDAGAFRPRFLTFIGQAVTAQPIQVRVTADAVSSGGNVTVNFFPALQSTAGATQNINSNIVAGMTFKFLPSHKAGLVVGGNAFYLAMPRLPDQSPYETSAEYDEETAVSIRLTYGSLFGQNQFGMINDCVWGSTLVPEYSMRVIFPL